MLIASDKFPPLWSARLNAATTEQSLGLSLNALCNARTETLKAQIPYESCFGDPSSNQPLKISNHVYQIIFRTYSYNMRKAKTQ